MNFLTKDFNNIYKNLALIIFFFFKNSEGHAKE